MPRCDLDRKWTLDVEDEVHAVFGGQRLPHVETLGEHSLGGTMIAIASLTLVRLLVARGRTRRAATPHARDLAATAWTAVEAEVAAE